MKLSHLALVIVLSATTAFGVMKVAPQSATTPTATAKESAFQRVDKAGVLRCGYIIWAPFLAQDMATKKMSGIVFDYVEAIAQELGWKVEWTEEVGWGNYAEGLKTNRYDAMCMPVYETGLRAKFSLMTTSIYNNGLYAYGRADDARFDASMDSLNDPSVTLAFVEGDAVSTALKKNVFPRAKEMLLPQLIDQGQYLMTVGTRKADAGFASPYAINKYNEGAEAKLKLIGGQKPVSVYGNALAVQMGEYDLKFALDSAIQALLKNGAAKQIIEAYRKDGFLLPTEY
ncbi:MAG TPA: hypothetical protein DCY07_04805 [Rhodospirillaceae bacterium]|nr:hypothetical protein [Rhodospirillaceae bacterium]